MSADIEWRIYYGCGWMFSSHDGGPEDSPAVNVQVIVQRDPEVGRILITSPPGIYWWDDGVWFGCMDSLGAGLFDYLSLPGFKVVRFGRTMPITARFRRLFAKAAEDQDFPRKSGWRPHEKPDWLTWHD